MLLAFYFHAYGVLFPRPGVSTPPFGDETPRLGDASPPFGVFVATDVLVKQRDEKMGLRVKSLQHFALVDVLFHVVLHSAYILQLLIHQFHHMERVEGMHSVRAVSMYRR